MSPTGPAPSLPAGRYGRAPHPQAARRRTVAFAALGAGAVALAVWIGLGAGSAPVTWKDVGYSVDGAAGVEVVFDVIRPDPSVAVRCRLQALNIQYAQVGLLTVDVAGAEDRTQRLSATVATTEEAVTGLVDRCWVPED